MITLRFVGGSSMISETIRRFEYDFWTTHAEALLPDGQHLLGAYVKEGVLIKPRDYDKGQFDRELYVTLAATDEQTESFYAFLHSQVGKPYDTEAVIGIAMQRDWQNPDAWFCSELQAAAVCHCGVFPAHLATELNHVTPRDLLLIASGRTDLSTPTVAAADARRPAGLIRGWLQQRSPEMKDVLKWAVARGREPSSYVGLAMVLTAMHMADAQAWASNISMMATGFFGILGMVIKETSSSSS